jgi:hypothetical protein
VALTDGFGLARLLRKQVGTEAEFAARREALAAHARSQLAERMKGHVLAQLRAGAKVSLDEPFLRSLEEVEPSQAQLDHVLATIGGRPLRYSDIVADVRGMRASGGHTGASVRVSLAWRAVDARLVEEVAVERGLLRDPALVALQREHRDAALGWAAVVHMMDAAPAPTEREIAAFHERHAAAFGKPLSKVRPQAAAGAAREKREAAFTRGVAALRQKATIAIDRDALARATPRRG